MPFTLSHAVLAPPIAKLTGYRLPIAALAIGTMTPDLYRLFTQAEYDQSHQWSGILFPNLLIGLGFCLLWYGLYRTVIFRILGILKPLSLDNLDKISGFIIAVIISLIIGISTHLIWDGLTHSDFRSFAFEDFLNRSVSFGAQVYPMHRILQISTSILALPFLAWMSIHYYFKFHQSIPVLAKIKKYALALFSISILSGLASYLNFARQVKNEPLADDLYWYIGKSINQFSSTALIIFSIGCLIFLILDRNQWFNKT